MKFTVVTLFPRLIEGFLSEGLLGQAHERGDVIAATMNPREFTYDVHHTVDDKAFGGGDGMVMKLEPLVACVRALRSAEPCHVVLLTPQGRPWSQRLAAEYALKPERVVLVCGRYAGIDQRFSAFVDDEISLGDFILNGGEIAACAMIEACARLKPGVLGNAASSAHDSFAAGLLECPQFTRPREFEGLPVPEPLLSGHHSKILQFTRAVSRLQTALKRPDLLAPGDLTTADFAETEPLSEVELKALGMSRDTLFRLKESQ